LRNAKGSFVKSVCPSDHHSVCLSVRQHGKTRPPLHGI